MFMQRIVTDGLAQVSFVISSGEPKQAVVIDPRRDVDIYLEIADAHGLAITHIFETHIHADYASGARELAHVTGATVYESSVAGFRFEHRPVDDGDVIEVGDLHIEVLLTPGHTPEHICLLVRDTREPDTAPFLFSGDMLFAGSVGRPDLLGDAQTRSLAAALYHTIHDRLMQLDDDIIVYPGHGAGSACGKQIGDAASTTMGQEKRFNYAFQPMSHDAFVRLILDGLPESPPYFPVMKRLNREGPEILGGIPGPRRLDAADLRAVQSGTAGNITLLDVRRSDPFGHGHLSGSLNIGLEPNLSNWAGWAIPHGRAIALIVDNPADVPEAVTYLTRIALDDIYGYAVADLATWERAGLAVSRIELVEVDQVYQGLDDGRLQVLDVRNPDEWHSGHIPDALLVPLGALATAVSDGLDPHRPVAVTCAGGYRSSLGASILKSRGFGKVYNMSGGMNAWREAGLPVRREE